MSNPRRVETVQGFYPLEPLVRPHFDNPRLWTLEEHLSYIDSTGKKTGVSKGFVFDFASIPRFCWSIIGLSPATGGQRLPAIIHDKECADRVTPWREVDWRFNDGMKLCPIKFHRRILCYYAVFTFGPRW